MMKIPSSDGDKKYMEHTTILIQIVKHFQGIYLGKLVIYI